MSCGIVPQEQTTRRTQDLVGGRGLSLLYQISESISRVTPASGIVAGIHCMLTFTGKGKAFTCDGMTRRDFLQVGALGAIGLTLPDLMAARAAGVVKPGHDDRSCIMIFNLGAPATWISGT